MISIPKPEATKQRTIDKITASELIEWAEWFVLHEISRGGRSMGSIVSEIIHNAILWHTEGRGGTASKMDVPGK